MRCWRLTEVASEYCILVKGAIYCAAAADVTALFCLSMLIFPFVSQKLRFVVSASARDSSGSSVSRSDVGLLLSSPGDAASAFLVDTKVFIVN